MKKVFQLVEKMCLTVRRISGHQKKAAFTIS